MNLYEDMSDRYKHYIGKRLRITNMEGEPNYAGKEGVCNYVDSMGQLHGSWGGLAIQPEHDSFKVVGE